MTTELESLESTADHSYQSYRSLSTAAVASVIVGCASFLAMFDWTLVSIPVIGVPLGWFALRSVRRQRDEMAGEGLARLGLALSLVFLLVGPGLLMYIYLTEVPEGYARISYAELQPDSAQARQVVPPSALDLEGKRIFIKGYVYPGQQRFGIRDFLLVRDRGDCCFGGDPKITDRIRVRIVGDERLTYEPRLFKVAGTFHVEPQATALDGAPGGVLYHLEADYLQ